MTEQDLEDGLAAQEQELDDRNVADGGVGPGDAEEQGANTQSPYIKEGDSESIKKRLGMQAKKHQREMRALHDRLNSYEQHFNLQQQNQYSSPGQPDPVPKTEEERIAHAVRMALGMKEQEEQAHKVREQKEHVNNQYARLRDDFDNAAEKYDDFEDVVMHDKVPFTETMRDAFLLIENPSDVAYKLGKNKEELQRIAKLHPLDQVREINRLSFALMRGEDGVKKSSTQAEPLKVQPGLGANKAITNKHDVSTLRRRMREGDFR